MMKGTVVAVSKDRAVIQVGNGVRILSVFGPHSTEVGDELRGELRSYGCEVLTNTTKSEEIRVVIEEFDCTRSCDGNSFEQ